MYCKAAAASGSIVRAAITKRERRTHGVLYGAGVHIGFRQLTEEERRRLLSEEPFGADPPDPLRALRRLVHSIAERFRRGDRLAT
jgi:hypothetical protein